MPMYEYRCLSCGLEFEKLQHFSDPPITTCEACGGQVKKLISQTSFILKGTGWYVTDYGRKGANNGGSSPARKSESSAGTDNKTSDAGSSKGKDKSGGKEQSAAA